MVRVCDAARRRDLYEVCPRKDHRGVDLISDVLPFGRLWYGQPTATTNAVSYAMHHSRSRDAVIRVHGSAGNVIQTNEREGEFKEREPAKTHGLGGGVGRGLGIGAILGVGVGLGVGVAVAVGVGVGVGVGVPCDGTCGSV